MFEAVGIEFELIDLIHHGTQGLNIFFQPPIRHSYPITSIIIREVSQEYSILKEIDDTRCGGSNPLGISSTLDMQWCSTVYFISIQVERMR